MDAKLYLKELARMCHSNDYCVTCDAKDVCMDREGRDHVYTSNEEKLVEVVEKWSKEHHVLSNDEMMQKTFGKIEIVLPMSGAATIKTPDGQVKDFRSWLTDEYVRPPIIKKGCWNCGHQKALTTSYPCSICHGYEGTTDEPSYWEAKKE